MSEVFAEVVEIDRVEPHGNADRLEVATVKGFTVVVGKGSFAAGQRAAYFPPNLLIPDELADKLGVTKYLKHAVYADGEGASQCRVSGCRLRGQPSFGFLASLDVVAPGVDLDVGRDLNPVVGGKKYTPPVRVTCSEAADEHPLFHKYTSIENYQRYPDVIAEGTPVRITEKIHGTNCRVGLVRHDDGTTEFMAGSSGLRRKKPPEGRACMYWEPLSNPQVAALLAVLMAEHKSVIVFGEVYGQGVQDLDYGIASGRSFRVFDISVDGKYLPWSEVELLCGDCGVWTVPLLHCGPFSKEIVASLTDGPTTLGNPRSAFKGREGVVITPLTETWSAALCGRLILKSVSADYLDRKGAEDNE